MDRNKKDKYRKQGWGSYNNDVEPEYDVVDDQEGHVRILPAMPIHAERDYADRDLTGSSSAQSLSLLRNGNASMLPREVPLTSADNTTLTDGVSPSSSLPSKHGPAVNRDLKPSRRKIRIDKRFTPVLPVDQGSHRRSPSPPAELVNDLPRLTLREACRRGGAKATKKAEFSSHTEGLQSAQSDSSLHTNPRHSLDLETITNNTETRLQADQERVPLKRHHHEWPQTKEDFDQHEFVPMEKPQQTCEEDWYVGACTRADAEHALHLVNKDGAFLVRDCSINTDREPLVLAVYHEKKVYNVKIRFMESIGKYALGTGQRSNDMFDSVADIVRFHSIFPIMLISGRNVPGNKCPDNCVLTCPVMKRDVDQLLQ